MTLHSGIVMAGLIALDQLKKAPGNGRALFLVR
jgi:hypothetical protein